MSQCTGCEFLSWNWKNIGDKDYLVTYSCHVTEKVPSGLFIYRRLLTKDQIYSDEIKECPKPNWCK